MLKKMSIILVAVLLMVMTAMPVYAKNTAGSTTIETTVDNAMQIGMNIASTIGAAIAVILLIVVAIKYMSAAPSDKAEIKKHMVVYVVGAVLLLCASGVLQLVKNFGDSIIGTEGGSSITVTKPDITIN